MPFARISLRKGKSPDYLRALSDNLHRALVEAFEVPPADRFQVIEQLDPEALVYDRGYFSGERSDDFVLIAITAGRPRSTAVKQQFYRRVVELLGQAPGLRPDDVMVVVTTTERDGWSFSNGLTQMVVEEVPA
ncbi:tautomerase family protein [Labrys okinawensis]|uniref:Tautomerase family protein n=1 Tax=Labrys okinawensis TaxID=346911 RepID=A0A2S9QBC6_9HYPH|nr:tautomerase family protein [Labrys okinawensis]PRH86656.1 tautomerase family protein [Labrys okinawensis]